MEKQLIKEIMKRLESENIDVSEIEQKPLFVILWEKFCFFVEIHDLSTIFKFMAKLSILACFGIILYNPQPSIEKITEIAKFKDFYLPKFLFGSVIILSFDKIISFFNSIFASFCSAFESKRKEYKDCGSFFGVPTSEIIDHLITERSFKSDCKTKFGLNQRNFDAIAKRLEEIGVLTRGENNSRIFNDEFTRQDLSEILYGKNNPKEIETLWKKTKSGLSSLSSSQFVSRKINA